MKLEVSTKHLRSALARLSSIPGAHGASVFTQAVRLTADMQGLTLFRFTSEATISILVEEVKIEDEGDAICVNYSSLSNLVSGMPGKDIAISSDDRKIYLVSGRSKSSLSVFVDDLDAEPADMEKGIESIDIAIEELSRLFNFVSPAMSSDMAGRPGLCGVCIRMMLGKLSFIATDGKRCHIAMEEMVFPVNCLISSSGVDCIMKTIGTEAGACTLGVGESTISVISSNVEVCVSLVNEGFPNVENFLTRPESSIISKVLFSRDEIIEALKTCSSATEGDSKMVSIDVNGDKATIYATNKHDADMSVEIECEATSNAKIHGPSIQIATAMALLPPREDGKIEIIHHFGSVMMMGENRATFVALKKPE